ncbi:porin [Vibrio sp. SM6]|uniref:Porin n=1 Tax=Vibrio agarilyticus TaxID=2726741 RepID=A0A7X8TNQ2_9VIBR|nr:porin [Vibrio agarilyticus]NLS12110.1 porin [Vibrio agarilyticus]
MKKAVLAAAILTSLTMAPAYAATVYDDNGTVLKVGGRAEGRFNISDNNETDATATEKATTKFEDKSRARVKVEGSTQIASNLFGFGKYESEFKRSYDAATDKYDNKIDNRYFFAGLNFDDNFISYGKQDSAQVMVTDFTDVLESFGGSSADIVEGAKDKLDGNFVYGGDFGPVVVQANMVAARATDRNSYGIAGLYTLDEYNLDLGLGYVKQKDPKYSEYQVTLGGQWIYEQFTLGGLFVTGKQEGETLTGFELAGQYQVLPQLDLVLVYNYREDVKGDNETEVNETTIEAVYKFDKNLRTYAAFVFDSLGGMDHHDQFQAGIRYDF